eukprot:458519-Lingulodinium_polyedra.AAC.1
MRIGVKDQYKYCDFERDDEEYQPVPESASNPACTEVFLDYSPSWHQIREMFERGDGKQYHGLDPSQMKLVYTNAVRRERIAGSDL